MTLNQRQIETKVKIIDFKEKYWEQKNSEWKILNRLLHDNHDLSYNHCRRLAKQIVKK